MCSIIRRDYHTPSWVHAFTIGKGVHGTEYGTDARQEWNIMIPRQTHSVNVSYVDTTDELPDTDAVFTDVPLLTIAVKTADCIPVLLWDDRKRMVAAIHAGWKGTVQYIVRETILKMQSDGADLHAIIGPGISLESFEVGDEVYDRFHEAGFPMDRIARRFDSGRWHIDLWEANKWILDQCGVTDIHVDGTDTMTTENLYSARRETINTGRNINAIMILP